MSLRDRLYRWWRPAQWADDHPLEARADRTADGRGGKTLGRWFGHTFSRPDDLDKAVRERIDVERDFKKTR